MPDPEIPAPDDVPKKVVETTVSTAVVTTVTDQTQIPWWKSQRFIALVQSTVLWVLGWLISALSTDEWAWRAMAIGVATNILVLLKDWWNPSVVAPKFAQALGANKSNAEIMVFKKPEGP
jgi:hypothetical protein